jgi:hypothetical protein
MFLILKVPLTSNSLINNVPNAAMITKFLYFNVIEQGFKLLSAVPPEPKTHLSLVY